MCGEGGVVMSKVVSEADPILMLCAESGNASYKLDNHINRLFYLVFISSLWSTVSRNNENNINKKPDQPAHGNR